MRVGLLQGVLQVVYSLNPDRNNLETLLNITLEFYINQVQIDII